MRGRQAPGPDEGAAQVHHAGPDGRERRGQRVEPDVGANFLFLFFFVRADALRTSREKLKITLVHNSERSTSVLHLIESLSLDESVFDVPRGRPFVILNMIT